jgi:hypothetical protein
VSPPDAPTAEPAEPTEQLAIEPKIPPTESPPDAPPSPTLEPIGPII